MSGCSELRGGRRPAQRGWAAESHGGPYEEVLLEVQVDHDALVRERGRNLRAVVDRVARAFVTRGEARGGEARLNLTARTGEYTPRTMSDLHADFERWSATPYPPCPADLSGVDLVMLDAVAASYLQRWLRGVRAASAEFRLRSLLETLDEQVLARAGGECLEYFEALADLLRRALTPEEA